MKFLSLVLACASLISTISTAPIVPFKNKTAAECNWNNIKYRKVDKEATIHAKQIWDFLVDKIGNENGAAGLIGNLYAQSRLIPSDLELIYERSLGLNSKQYTKAVNNGSYKEFDSDRAGYGLAHWNTKYQKKRLLEYAQDSEKSISDLNMQLEFLWKEINEDYKKVAHILQDKNVSIQEASNAVVLNYKTPLDRSQYVLTKRSNYGKMFKDACGTQ
ncbi:hypothetical protein PIROE2DRAFT_17777 [Piromyces sp. E2]|nr:hypothetical protein PIROE2DRAFT_17777 [Piromyces sp. E2]|eukprot:OUM57291.1 hypothetical protein PIROE2DRAFT_17777 [Piromyces sp. E2]